MTVPVPVPFRIFFNPLDALTGRIDDTAKMIVAQASLNYVIL